MMCNLPKHTELNLIKKTVAVFEDLLGEHIQGWRTCFASHDTVDLILEHSDFAWDGSMWNDDLPSIIEGYGRELLEIPFATYSDTALGVDITSPANPPTRNAAGRCLAKSPSRSARPWRSSEEWPVTPSSSPGRSPPA